jgi:hypothetical protein
MSRNGFKWNVNEILNLQREYELLELTVQEIAVLHKRSVSAILYKLEAESLISQKNSTSSFPKSKSKKVSKMQLRSSSK